MAESTGLLRPKLDAPHQITELFSTIQVGFFEFRCPVVFDLNWSWLPGSSGRASRPRREHSEFSRGLPNGHLPIGRRPRSKPTGKRQCTAYSPVQPMPDARPVPTLDIRGLTGHNGFRLPWKLGTACRLRRFDWPLNVRNHAVPFDRSASSVSLPRLRTISIGSTGTMTRSTASRSRCSGC